MRIPNNKGGRVTNNHVFLPKKVSTTRTGLYSMKSLAQGVLGNLQTT